VKQHLKHLTHQDTCRWHRVGRSSDTCMVSPTYVDVHVYMHDVFTIERRHTSCGRTHVGLGLGFVPYLLFVIFSVHVFVASQTLDLTSKYMCACNVPFSRGRSNLVGRVRTLLLIWNNRIHCLLSIRMEVRSPIDLRYRDTPYTKAHSVVRDG
jgi:hypothetical protein